MVSITVQEVVKSLVIDSKCLKYYEIKIIYLIIYQFYCITCIFFSKNINMCYFTNIR